MAPVPGTGWALVLPKTALSANRALLTIAYHDSDTLCNSPAVAAATIRDTAPAFTPGHAGHPGDLIIAFTNDLAMAAGDRVRLVLAGFGGAS